MGRLRSRRKCSAQKDPDQQNFSEDLPVVGMLVVEWVTLFSIEPTEYPELVGRSDMPEAQRRSAVSILKPTMNCDAGGRDDGSLTGDCAFLC